MRVLLAIDNSESPAVATQMVMNQAQPGKTEVLVLDVVRPPSLLVAREMVGFDATLENAWEKQEGEAEQLVESVAAKIRASGAEVSCSVELGEPRTKILEMAEKWQADLIVVGSNQRTKGTGYSPSGVPEEIVRRASCSVEIVRGPQKEIPELV